MHYMLRFVVAWVMQVCVAQNPATNSGHAPSLRHTAFPAVNASALSSQSTLFSSQKFREARNKLLKATTALKCLKTVQFDRLSREKQLEAYRKTGVELPPIMDLNNFGVFLPWDLAGTLHLGEKYKMQPTARVLNRFIRAVPSILSFLSGSGVVISSKGHVLTALHVLGDLIDRRPELTESFLRGVDWKSNPDGITLSEVSVSFPNAPLGVALQAVPEAKFEGIRIVALPDLSIRVAELKKKDSALSDQAALKRLFDGDGKVAW